LRRRIKRKVTGKGSHRKGGGSFVPPQKTNKVPEGETEKRDQKICSKAWYTDLLNGPDPRHPSWKNYKGRSGRPGLDVKAKRTRMGGREGGVKRGMPHQR